MHQEVVIRVFLLAHHLHYAGRVGHSRDPGRADEGVDFVFGEEVQKLGEEYAGSRGDGKGQGTEAENEYRLLREKGLGLG